MFFLKPPALLVGLSLIFVTVMETKAQRPGGGGPPGRGGPNATVLKLVEKFDKDGDGVLNTDERALARKEAQSSGSARRGGPGGRGRRGRGGSQTTGKPGPRVSPADVETYSDASLFEPTVFRTLFLEFEAENWEKEMAEFKPTDVEVPATLTVDGKSFPNVGVSFRGSSSFFHVAEGMKRSLNLSMDFIDPNQRLYGYKTLNLLNGNGDASMMSSVLYSHIAGQRIATPKANFVKVVINGRSWGVYSSVQQFNKTFLDENFGTKKGARWKVLGSPNGDGGLRYLGEDVEPYRERFQIKSADNDQSWRDLINLCKVLNETPDDQLEAALDPILDIEGALWFLAVDVALINSDGYWVRASDYSLYQDPGGKFHILPHDMNEAFRGSRGGPGGPGGRGGGRRGPLDLLFGPPPGEGQGSPPNGFGPPQQQGRRPLGGPPQQDGGGRPGGRGPGGRGGPGAAGGGGGGGGVELDPLIGLDNLKMPLRSKLLSIPKFQTLYLQQIRTIAQDMLDWKSLGTHVEQFRDLIEKEVKADTRKLTTTEAFVTATNSKSPAQTGSLRSFAETRAAYLLGYKQIKSLPKETVKLKSTSKNPKEKWTTKTKPKVAPPILSRGKSSVVINEIMALNTSTASDPQGEFEDWIELHNQGDQAVDLSGWYLSDDVTNPHQWAFPKGTEIAADGHLIVWADKDSQAPVGLHASFRLSSTNGETVVLSNSKFIFDELKFGKQLENASFGRLKNGEIGSMTASPGTSNVK